MFLLSVVNYPCKNSLSRPNINLSNAIILVIKRLVLFVSKLGDSSTVDKPRKASDTSCSILYY